MKNPQNYSYIKGSRRRGFFGGYQSLWLAEDHLLLLRSSGWADRWRESSLRFYFRDIQGLIFCEDKKRRNMSLAFLCPAIFFLIMALLFRETGYLFHIPIALIFIVFAMTQWLKGPTCISQIHTAVQSTRLPCIRMRKAEKLKSQLLPLIEKAQGHFENQHKHILQEREAQAVSDQDLNNTLSFTSKKPQNNPLQVPPEFHHNIHLLAFLSLFSQAVTATFALQSTGQMLFFLDTILILVSLGLLVVALYRQSRSKIRGNLTWITWLGLASLVFFLLMNFGLLIEIFTNLMDTDAPPPNEYEIWRLMAGIDPAESSFLRLLLQAKICVYGVIAATGLVLSFRAGKKKGEQNG